MSWQQIQTTLVSIAASAIVAAVAKWWNWKVTAEQRAQLQWALEQAVAYVALKLKNASGDQKKKEALSVAHSLAPKALAKLDPGQQELLVDSTYARMKASLPAPSVHFTPGDQIPVDVVDLEGRPTPLPPPKRAP